MLYTIKINGNKVAKLEKEDYNNRDVEKIIVNTDTKEAVFGVKFVPYGATEKIFESFNKENLENSEVQAVESLFSSQKRTKLSL